MILDGGLADRILDAAQQDNVAVGDASRVKVADLDPSLRVEQVDVELEGVADGVGVERDVIRGASVELNIIDLYFHHRGTITCIDVVDDHVEIGLVDNAHGIPCPLALDQTVVAPDDTVRRAGEAVCEERSLAGLIVDDVVQDNLIGHQGCTDRLAGIRSKELDVGELGDDAILVDLQFGIRLAQQEDMRFPEDLAPRILGAAAVVAAAAAVEHSLAARIRGLGEYRVLLRIYSQRRGAQHRVMVALDLGPRIERGPGIRIGVAGERVEIRIRYRGQVDVYIFGIDGDRDVAGNLGATEEAHLVLRVDLRVFRVSIAVRSHRGDISLGMSADRHIVHDRRQRNSVSKQVGTTPNLCPRRGIVLVAGADAGIREGFTVGTEAAGIGLGVGQCID